MDIGKPEHLYTVEPLEDPVPQTRPAKSDEPAEPEPAAPHEPEQVPAGA
jgi:hypothetical protein